MDKCCTGKREGYNPSCDIKVTKVNPTMTKKLSHKKEIK